MTWMENFTSGYGRWQPLIWLAAMVLVWLIAVVIRSFGVKAYKPETKQTEPFLSGDAVELSELHIKASNLYWGFVESMRGYYRFLTRIHTGQPGDYLLWFFGVTAAVFLVGVLS